MASKSPRSRRSRPAPAADPPALETEARFRLLFDNTSDALFLHASGGHGRPGTFLEVNATACRVLGYTREELLQRSPVDIDAPECPPMDPAVLDQLLRTGHATFERVHVTKDGRRVPVEISAHRLEVDGQAVVLSGARDITERQCVAEEHRAAADLSRLVNNARSLDELLTELAPLVSRWSGCASVGVRLARHGDFPYRATLHFPERLLTEENCLRAGPDEPLECLCGCVLDRKGDPNQPYFTARGSFWTNDSAAFLASLKNQQWPTHLRGLCTRLGFQSMALVPLTAGGVTMGLLQLMDPQPGRFHPVRLAMLERLADSVGMAVSQRLATDALRESELRYRSLFWNNHATMMLLDPDNGMIMDANPAACRFYGYRWGELVGRPFADITVLPAEEVREELHRAQAELRRSFRLPQRLANGDVRDVEVFAGSIPVGERNQLYVIVHDITERRRAEEALQRAHEQLEHKVRDRTAELSRVVTQLRGEFQERERMEAQLRQNVEMQSAVNALLRLSLEDLPLEELLRRAMDLLATAAPLGPEQPAALRLCGEGGELRVVARRGVEADADPGLAAACQDALDRHQAQHAPGAGTYVVPLRGGGAALGVITVGTGPDAPDERLAGLLGAVADTMAGILVRRRAEGALARAESAYQHLLHSISGIVWEADGAGRLTFISEHAERVLGYPRQRWRSEPRLWGELLHPDDAAAASAAMAEGLRTGRGFEREYRLRAAGGHDVWFRDVVSVVANGDGPARVRGVMIDVTSRRQAEDALEEANNLLEAMVRAQSRFIAEQDPQAFFQQALGSVLQLTGSLAGFMGEVVQSGGQPVLRVHARAGMQRPVDAPAGLPAEMGFDNLDSLFGAVVRTGQAVYSNAPGTDPRSAPLPPGHPPVHGFLGVPIFTGNRLVGVVGLANRPGGYDAAVVEYLQPFLSTCGSVVEAYRHVRQRREAQEALRQSEERFRQMAENVREAFWMVDTRERRMLYVSPAFESIWGEPADAVYRRPERWEEMVHPADRDAMRAKFIQWAREPGDAEYRILRADGVERWVRTAASPVRDDAGQVFRVVGVSEDITDRKRQTEALLEARRQATVGRLAAAVAHEVNNPLGAIKAQLTLLRQDLTDVLPAATTNLAVVGEQVDRIARTVQALLGFARQRHVQGQAVPLAEIIDSVVKLFSSSFRARGISLDVVLPPSLPILHGDVDQLQEVFVNILENARELLRSGNLVKIAGEVGPQEVEVRVENNGPPFKDGAEKIFEPFYTTRTEGVGLGLAIARRICVAHGGTLVAENRTHSEGGGVRFRIRLPRVAPMLSPLAAWTAEPVKA